MGFIPDIQLAPNQPYSQLIKILAEGVYDIFVGFGSGFYANLVSDLTSSKLEDNISGIDGVKNEKIPFSCIRIFAGSSIEGYYVHERSDRRRNFYTSVFGIVLPKQ
ncbi:unnamed protein product [Adineta steineri]|uniref:Uncharacterized protein n=1 Tax=Adineta steineri TaxID=433720 RepID=A0A816FTG2_9BILA|nr:unnamed protein product [Adineta steineri]CAF1418705.1 unnamed protein product [Adineta steineri]CAF1563039.1 unnamed protein product [Adineta steineri]CAF1665549.1 unnamed protein product [Adineta steineri]